MHYLHLLVGLFAGSVIGALAGACYAAWRLKGERTLPEALQALRTNSPPRRPPV